MPAFVVIVVAAVAIAAAAAARSRGDPGVPTPGPPAANVKISKRSFNADLFTMGLLSLAAMSSSMAAIMLIAGTGSPPSPP